ncbi:hypothetical protein [Falsirhodobacter sp. alg1]|uniref:hypothetical protein n=1 Tax=Falsirhodobacter sp. alg1 TaxID=1472418 RepID=UPI0005EF781D|nr:hypothetical protein [Falsirhodobacter sp. alg1]
MARQKFNILAIGQAGRLEYEAIILATSLRLADPDFPGTLYIAEPQPGPRWASDPRMSKTGRALLEDLGAEVIGFDAEVFGDAYPNGNKIEALAALPDEPFLFLDTDTLILGSFAGVKFDFNRPSASMKRENTWPAEELYGPSVGETWQGLYKEFGVPFEPTLDPDEPEGYWRRYMYFNAGWFFYKSPKQFGKRYLEWAKKVWHDRPEIITCQQMDPWLDQAVLPLVIASFGGGRPGPELAGMDGDVTCHWRILPLMFARESDKAVAMMQRVAEQNAVRNKLQKYGATRKMLYEGNGMKVRGLFDRNDLPRKEQAIRNRIRREGLWAR